MINRLLCYFFGHRWERNGLTTSQGYGETCFRCGDGAFVFDPPISIPPGETRAISIAMEIRK